MNNIDSYKVDYFSNCELLKSLVGKTLTEVLFIKHKRYNPKAPFKKFHLLKVALPLVVDSVNFVGYHSFLLFRDVDLILENFIKKMGKWTLERPEKGGIEFKFGDISVYFVDTNGRSVLKVRESKTYKKLLKRLGLDLRVASLDQFEYVLRLRQNKYRNIGKVLFNDLQVCGINNYEISQMLYATGLSPKRRTDKITRDEMKIMLECVQNEKYVDSSFLPIYINIGEDQVLYWNPSVQTKV